GGTASNPRREWQDALNSLERVEGFLNQRGFTSQKRNSSRGLSFSPPAKNHRWKLGTRVRHAKFGLGTVIECEGEGEDTRLTVSFPGYGQKKIVEKYASLERV